VSAHSPYEQLKDDFGYLGLDAAAECFATLAEEAMAESWPPVVYLERVIAEQARATRNRRLAARLRLHISLGAARCPSSTSPSSRRSTASSSTTSRHCALSPRGRPILFLGQPGCGKSHLATALAILAG
jgi:DNA replication protein DnaC